MILAGLAQAQMSASMCGSLANGYGPFDYRTEKLQLVIVEGAHFTTEVEMLIRGKSGYLGGDLDYTLRASPNHHRALISLKRYSERHKTTRIPGANYDIECYFVRAVTFKPDDNTARMLFAMFLNVHGRRKEALQQMAFAERFVGHSAFGHHNLGLVYLELQEFSKALEHSHKAIALGFHRADLTDKLKAAGRWSDPAPAAEEVPASAASAAAHE